MIQKECCDVLMSLSRGKVQWGVPRSRRCVWRSSLLQQLLYYIRFPQSGRNVEWGLVILKGKVRTQVWWTEKTTVLSWKIQQTSLLGMRGYVQLWHNTTKNLIYLFLKFQKGDDGGFKHLKHPLSNLLEWELWKAFLLRNYPHSLIPAILYQFFSPLMILFWRERGHKGRYPGKTEIPGRDNLQQLSHTHWECIILLVLPSHNQKWGDRGNQDGWGRLPAESSDNQFFLCLPSCHPGISCIGLEWRAPYYSSPKDMRHS